MIWRIIFLAAIVAGVGGCDSLFYEKYPLHAAVRSGDVDAVKELIEESPSMISARAGLGVTPLHLAAINGHSVIVKLLIHAGAALEAEESTGLRPLHQAVRHRRQDVAELLLRFGAQVDPIDQIGSTPLNWAVVGHNKVMIRLLVQYGADPTRKGATGESAIEWAREIGDQELLTTLNMAASKMTSPGT